MASVRSNSILSLKEVLISRRSNEDKLATKQLGPPGPNVNIKQVSDGGGGVHPDGSRTDTAAPTATGVARHAPSV